MKFISDIITFITELDKKRYAIYLACALVAVVLLGGLITYYFYSKGTFLVQHITSLQKQSQETKEVTTTYELIQERKDSVISALEKEKDFELKSFFASFCKENNLRPESSWTTISSTIDGNELIEEISLQATFTQFTMQRVVALLEGLEKKELVYVKSLRAFKEGEHKKTSKTISLDITLATLKYRQSQGE